MLAITGGTGFIGTHLARAALAAGRPVRVLARNASRADELTRAGAEFAKADILEPESLQEGLRGAEAVIHLVGIIQERGRQTFEAVHHLGTINAVAAAQASGVRRFLHMSAVGTRPNAASRYHRTNWRGEEAVRKSDLAWTIYRPSVVYGEGDDFLSRFIALSRWSPVMPIPGEGKNRLQPVWVGDVVACFLQSLDRAETVGRVYELGGPRAYTLEEIVDLLLEALGRKRPKIHLPLSILRVGATAFEKMLPSPPLTHDQLLMLREDNVCDTQAMRETFDVEMLDLREGLRRMLPPDHQRRSRTPG
jgi:uncharacterized protein YbjT (DUF2867 family)